MGGLYYEQFVVGRVHRHALTRTVTETDNVLITSLTINVQPLHLDAEFARQGMHGQILVNSLFTLGLVSSFPISELTMGTTQGNLGFESVTFPKPVFVGDTLRAETTIVDRRVSHSRPDAGIVTFEHRGYNQRDQVVCTCRRAALMLRLPSADQIPAVDGVVGAGHEGR